MPENTVIRGLLEDLRGGGFNTNITVNNFQFNGQKIISFDNGVVFSVDAGGLARATVIADIQSTAF